MAWHANFKRSWDALRGNYDDMFYKMWEYFLLSSAGAFRARSNQLWQIVLSKKGMLGGYVSVR
jgi:cyclopropane-fatty-acyl-phospholipid synthase